MSAIGDKVSGLVMGVIGAVILLLVGIALGPTVITSITDINATALADVPMGTVIVLLASYVPFFYYLGIVLGAITAFWGVVKYS
ncbi:unnamed protein product [marine sediment metagenome]|uniref:Uncharacterized protein n=1 Tax=marine sediment metagenome TaxID=412755 RepID=X1CTJ5_9ZZZZ